MAAFSLHYLGRKRTIILASPLATLGWIFIATATRYEVVIASRFLNGFCVGLCLPSAQVYVSFLQFSFLIIQMIIYFHWFSWFFTFCVSKCNKKKIFFKNIDSDRSAKVVIQKYVESWVHYHQYSCRSPF